MSVNDSADDLDHIAQSAAFTAGAVEACRFHPEVTINVGDPEAENRAYAIAMNQWKAGGRVFESIEVTDAVKEVLDLAAEGECPQCAYRASHD